jgi:ATP phosphoribosyltransferase
MAATLTKKAVLIATKYPRSTKTWFFQRILTTWKKKKYKKYLFENDFNSLNIVKIVVNLKPEQ